MRRGAGGSGGGAPTPGDGRLGEVIAAIAELATATTAPLNAALRKIADLARQLARAEYAALGVVDDSGQLVHFVPSGLSDAVVQAIPHWPEGRGLLGALTAERRTIRIAEIARDPRSVGFPQNHPEMSSFLGVPILGRERALGNLYLANKLGAPEFSEEDQRIIEALAAHAAVAIENLRLVARLREVNRAREEELKLISHDLRAPLTVILGQAQMVRRMLGTGRTEPALQSVDAIVVGAKRMNRLIQDLVDAARLEVGRLELQLEPVDLARFTVDLRDGLVGGDAARIRIEAAPGLPTVAADPARLERVVLNLLTNALKYSPPERPVVVRLEARGGQAEVSVADEGVGVAPDELPRLFSRYYRTRQAGQAEGLGLGLYITRRLVEAHGGRIWAESPGVGRGATFRFALPATGPAAAAPPGAGEESCA